MGRNSLSGVLEHVKNLGLRPNSILDVGVAYGTPDLFGHFAQTRYLLVEPLIEYEEVMRGICREHPAEYVLAAAGSEAGYRVLNVHPDRSGSSFYRESEGPQVDGIPRLVPVVTLDEVCQERSFQPPFVIKSDTQGADLNVLSGAVQTLKETELVLLEVFLFQFYKGIPQFSAVIDFMKQHGFVPYDFFGAIRRPYDDALAQIDVAFVKEKGFLRESHHFATPKQRKELTQARKKHLNPSPPSDSYIGSKLSNLEIPPAESIRRILLIRSGEMEITAHALQALALEFPLSETEVLCQPQVVPQIQSLASVSQVHVYERGFFRVDKFSSIQLDQLRAREFDLVVLVYSNPTGEGYAEVNRLGHLLAPKSMICIDSQRRWQKLLHERPLPTESSSRPPGLTQSNLEKVMSLKNIHRGERAFIIGMGPSLKVSDLDRLRNEISFGCNKVYLAFEETDWRPTHYSVIDLLVAQNNLSEIRALKLQKILTHPLFEIFGERDDITYVKALRNPGPPDAPHVQFGKDIAVGTYGGHTVLYFQMQLAYYMGIRELYLLGLDFQFRVPKASEEQTAHGETILVQTNEINHFHPDYRKPGEKWTMPRLDYQYKAFLCAKYVFEADGGNIFNASRQTDLTVFPRVSLDDLFG